MDDTVVEAANPPSLSLVHAMLAQGLPTTVVAESSLALLVTGVTMMANAAHNMVIAEPPQLIAGLGARLDGGVVSQLDREN
ncbi:hypothetical protein ABW19_dt0210607 [Dactylella cylindrospora]|nr:hypothetical protein ABW19_dt0210607 [Dactylella cylindrospora]